MQRQDKATRHLWCFSVLQRVAVRCSALQCIAVCCSVLQRVPVPMQRQKKATQYLWCVIVCCIVLQRVAVCCSVLQYQCGAQTKPRSASGSVPNTLSPGQWISSWSSNSVSLSRNTKSSPVSPPPPLAAAILKSKNKSRHIFLKSQPYSHLTSHLCYLVVSWLLRSSHCWEFRTGLFCKRAL